MLNTALTNSTDGGLGSLLMLIIPIALLVVLFVVSSRSQRKKDKEIADMRNNLSVGDEVTTIGGIIGKIVSIKEETCVIVTSRDNTKIRILKSAISHVDVKAEDIAAAVLAEEAAKDAPADTADEAVSDETK